MTEPLVASGLAELQKLTQEVDLICEELSARHQARLQCKKGCHQCCQDGLTVFEIEAQRIQSMYSEVLGEEAGPEGGCAFLGAEGQCRVYLARPYVCRTQGLPLRWEDYESESEGRDICPLNEEGPDLVELPSQHCFTLGPFEGRLAGLQAQSQGVKPGAELNRVPLRGLFVDPKVHS